MLVLSPHDGSNPEQFLYSIRQGFSAFHVAIEILYSIHRRNFYVGDSLNVDHVSKFALLFKNTIQYQ